MRWFVGVVFVLALGCSDDDPPLVAPEPDPYLARTSPENVLSNLTNAYRWRDIDGYAAQLDDAFEFVPTADVEVNFRTLNREQDLASTAAMFRDIRDIRIGTLHTPAADPTIAPYSDDPTTFREIFSQGTSIDVLSSDVTPDGHSVIYRIHHHPSRLIFRRTDGSPPTFTLVHLADLYSSQREFPVETYTWSQLKERYLP